MKNFITLRLKYFPSIWLSCVFLIFYTRVGAPFEFKISLALLSIIFAAPLIGEFFIRQFAPGFEKFNSFPTRFLLGILAGNFLLLISVLVFPMNIGWCWVVLLLGFAFIAFLKVHSRGENYRVEVCKALLCGSRSEALLIIFAPILVGIWCRELLQTPLIYENFLVIRSWPDILVHLAQIGMLARSSGFGGLSDPSMLGASPHIYHVTSYLFPALMTYLSAGASLVWYSCFMVPLGMLLTSFAAYSLTRPFFGLWPGLFAGIAVLSIPDAFQMGFGNQLMGGYYWMQMISPALPYGIACAALAFGFLIQACLTKKPQYVLLAYFFAGLTLIYKAQIFVSISFIIFIAPAFYFGTITKIKRALLVLFLSCFYFGVIYASQFFASLPLIRFDGSALGSYSHLIVSNQGPGLIASAYSWLSQWTSHYWLLSAGLFAAYVLLVSLGFLLPIYIGIFFLLRKKVPNLLLWIPLLVALNYIVMATGLALDNRGLGSPEDLLHRPYIWMYFIFITFSTAAICRWICAKQLSQSKTLIFLMGAVFILQFLGPLIFHRQIQHYPAWNAGDLRIPSCQYEVAQYIATHGSIRDVIQDGDNDPGFIFTGLSVRQAYAQDSKGVRGVGGLNNRLEELQELIKYSEASSIERFMQQKGIQWYIRNMKIGFNWPTVLSQKEVYSCGDYVLYRFY